MASYGSWRSPITAELVASGAIKLGQTVLDGQNVYWTESRPGEGGRTVIVRCLPDGRTTDMTPAPFNVRSRVHEYGGGAFTVAEDNIYFVNLVDQRLYRQAGGGEAEPVIPEGPRRYADFTVEANRRQLICVGEDHSTVGQEPENFVVAIDLQAGGKERILASGNDFYSSPRLSPDGTYLAWLAWNHPNMPWDGTELWVGRLGADGSVLESRKVAGGPEESITQPQWSPGGVLHFISDRNGWWNLYRRDNDFIESLCPMEAEFCQPPWVFGMSSYDFTSADGIICAYTYHGSWHLGRLETSTGKLEEIRLPYTEISDLKASSGQAVFCAGSPTEPAAIIRLELETGQWQVLRRTSELKVDTAYISVPEVVEFPSEQGRSAHGFFYAPRNPNFEAAAGESPPLVVKSHGGPTASASTTLAWEIQYWTSRGIAVLDVNYGGSTGYGRQYRQSLYGNWGVVDVDDCVHGARFLAAQGRVDGQRLIIRGSSAGGYTTLCALTFRDLFQAGASYYGISDLEALAKETHKFESRYLDRLVGPYSERSDLYRERSPIHFTHLLSCPVILFQGQEDEVVPPSQAESMVEALRAKGLAVAYLAFAGEQHGFRRAETIKRCLEAELYFYARIFAFQLPEPLEPVGIENLPAG